MLRLRDVRIALLGLAIGGCLAPAWGQQPQVHQSTPFQSVGDSFFEQFGFGASIRGRGWFANWGGGMAAPPFGNFDPNAGLRGGFGIQGNGWNGQFNFAAGQGFSRTNTLQSPGVTVMNGQGGVISDQQFSPFVIGVVPVVGGAVPGPLPAWAYVNESPSLPWQQQLADGSFKPESKDEPEEDVRKAVRAGRKRGPKPVDSLKLTRKNPAGEEPADGGAAGPVADGATVPTVADGATVPTVADDATATTDPPKAAAVETSAAEYYERGQRAEAGGRKTLAKIFYELAAKRAAGPLAEEIAARLQALE